MVNMMTHPADPFLTVLSGMANFIGINIKTFDKLYSQSEELRNTVDRLVDDYLRKYEDKLAVATPSTSPTLARFVQSQLEKDKDIVLAVQRKIQATTDELEREKNNVAFDIRKRKKLKNKLNETVADAKVAQEEFKANQAKTSAILRGSEDRFTNAMNFNKWKENNNK